MASLANNRQSLDHKIQMTSQRGPLKVTILKNVPSLAKMARMAKIRQPLNYMPNKIAKGPLGKWRIWRNSPKMRLNFLWYVQRAPFNSGDETKMVNMAMRPKWWIRHFRQICHFSQTHYFSRGPFGHLWIFAKPCCHFRHSSLFKEPLWTFLNFRQTLEEL